MGLNSLCREKKLGEQIVLDAHEARVVYVEEMD